MFNEKVIFLRDLVIIIFNLLNNMRRVNYCHCDNNVLVTLRISAESCYSCVTLLLCFLCLFLLFFRPFSKLNFS